MRINAEVRAAMAERIAPLDTEPIRQAYREGRFPRAEEVRDLDRRYRFDLFYQAHAYDVFPDDAGYTDTHVYTALKQIIPAL